MPLFPGAMNLTMLHPGSAAKPRRRSSTGAGCTENELRRRAMPWEAARRGHTRDDGRSRRFAQQRGCAAARSAGSATYRRGASAALCPGRQAGCILELWTARLSTAAGR